jgi:hypothetical protein
MPQSAEAKVQWVGLTHSMFAPSDFACIPPGFDHFGRSIKPCHSDFLQMRIRNRDGELSSPPPHIPPAPIDALSPHRCPCPLMASMVIGGRIFSWVWTDVGAPSFHFLRPQGFRRAVACAHLEGAGLRLCDGLGQGWLATCRRFALMYEGN